MMNRGKLLILQLAALGTAATLIVLPVTDDPVDWHHLSGWLRNASPETVVAEAGRLVLIGVAGWLAVITAVAWCACIAGTFDAVARITPRFVCRLLEGAFAASVVAGALAPTVLAASAADRPRFVPVAPVRDGRSAIEPVTLALVADPPSPGIAVPEPASEPSSPVVEPPAAAGTVHVVHRGESLWSIAHDASAGTPVDHYWRTLCDANRATLPSGDLNLLHPGDLVVLPDAAAVTDPGADPGLARR